MSFKGFSLLKDFMIEHPRHGFDIELLQIISKQFSLDLNGTHGVYHWHRVYKNALKIAEHYNIESSIFMLFALFHDSKRVNEDIDPRHGRRGSKFAQKLQCDIPMLKELSKKDFELLEYACSSHTKIDISHEFVNELVANICWDADRLDIGRVGFVVDPKYLCTDYAKQLAKSL